MESVEVCLFSTVESIYLLRIDHIYGKSIFISLSLSLNPTSLRLFHFGTLSPALALFRHSSVEPMLTFGSLHSSNTFTTI